jgi:hypothetical protein
LAGDPSRPPPFAPALTFDLTEDNLAGYGQLELDFGDSGVPVEAIVGARVVRSDTDLNAILVTNGVQSRHGKSERN